MLIPQHFGTPSAEEIRAFTRVVGSNVRFSAACTDKQLQGNIALDTIVFPQGTTGFVLYVPRWLVSDKLTDVSDILARRPLWSDGLDYRCIHLAGRPLPSPC